jgi:hypothetical protein
MKKTLTEWSMGLMNQLMMDSNIADKVRAKGVEGKSYAIFNVRDDGIVVLGETRYKFWNQLIGCQVKLPFESWALAVWDALVNMSKGGNKDALEHGLSVEIAKKAQREEEYNWVVERLFDCYTHVCNNRKGGAPSEGGQGEKGSSMAERVVVHEGGSGDVTVNINTDNVRKTLHFPDATGRAFLDVVLGVVDVKKSRI